MTCNVFLTGVTGALGSSLLPELLSLGFEVHCLIRPKNGQSAEQRLRAITGHPNAFAVPGDITQPLCGVDPAALPKIDKFVHAAADTSLDQAASAQVMAANKAGTAHTLALAEALGRPEFHYIGTAYIAGDALALGEEDVGSPLKVGAPRNPYETTKAEAERDVRRYPGPVTILRPSIVVGRSIDGEAPLLEGWYGFFRSAWRLREMLKRGNYFDEFGLRLFGTRSYPLRLPIVIPKADSTSMNLIQLDWLSATEAQLIALPARGRAYNLTHPDPVAIGSLLRWTFEALDLSQAVVISEAESRWTTSPAKLSVGRLINRELDRFRPYLRHSPEFISRTLYEDLGAAWPAPPAITPAFIELTMTAAERTWKAELERDQTPGGTRAADAASGRLALAAE